VVRHGPRSMPICQGLCNYCSVDTFYAFACVREVSSPWGSAWVAATGRGVTAVGLLATAEGFRAGLERRGIVVDSERAGEEASRLADRAARAVSETLEGLAVPLDDLPVDIADRPAWDRIVLEAVRAIPRGQTAGYGEMARRIGRPGAARAVGGAVGRNPVGLLIPCHRVIAGDGSLGGYGASARGGREAATELKQALLALEGVHIPRDRVSAR
jgi:methylated-DNA-[protein]-cysteine S-methyltransferase